MQLLSPLRLACGVTAANRLVFGPHETNLARGRALSARHTAYYQRRAAGGAGTIVVETASVHADDWPYERAPLAAECGEGWRAISSACRAEGALTIASLGHAGQQGDSAHSRAALWAPSRVPDVESREVPMEMAPEEITEITTAFATAAREAVLAGCDGVEVNAGQFSLVRQFLSDLTNHREDGYGQARRSRFAAEVLEAVREAIGPESVLGLRLSCDERAAQGGITPRSAVPLAAELAAEPDYLTVVRGSMYAVGATRPDGSTPAGFNTGLVERVRSGVDARVAVCAQGSIVAADMAEELVATGVSQLVEMTRAQIADAELGRKLAAGTPERIRPCVLCNQACQVRNAGTAAVSCVADPRSGHESEEPSDRAPFSGDTEVLVIGGGPAGLEAARVAADSGYRVTVVEREDRTGGALRTAAAGAGRERLADLADWLAAECLRLGVRIETGRSATSADVDARLATGGVVIMCTGSRPGPRDYHTDSGIEVWDAAELLASFGAADTCGPGGGPVVVHDPVGGAVAVSVCVSLAEAGREVHLVTPDHTVASGSTYAGDVAATSVRLARAGVTALTRSRIRSAGHGTVEVEHVWTGEVTRVKAGLLVDCGFRLPDDGLWRGPRLGMTRAGDAVAPRGIHEAVLEGRRAASSITEVSQ